MFLNFIHILNIWTVLLSTIGIASYKHYCQDQLKSFSIFGKFTKPCSLTAPCKKNKPKKTFACCSKKEKDTVFNISSSTNCFPKNKTTIQKKVCCTDKSNYSQSDILSSVITDNDASFNTVKIIWAHTPILIYFSFYTDMVVYEPVTYSKLGFYPPPHNTPLYILHESFLC